MVKGLEIFRQFFAPYSGQYVLIGGTAATLAMEEAGLEFRATKDLDIVLHVEAVTPDFGRAFWSFIETGGYQIRESAAGKPIFYRFQKPANGNYPVLLELFSRTPEGFEPAGGSHLTPIPIDEQVSSLSAILLDDDYYRFVMDNRRDSDGLSWVGAECLIPLKASAYLDLDARREQGDEVDSRAVNKHRNDVIRLSQLLAPAQRVQLARKVFDQLTRFLERLDGDNTFEPKAIGLSIGRQEIVRRIRQTYHSINGSELTRQQLHLRHHSPRG